MVSGWSRRQGRPHLCTDSWGTRGLATPERAAGSSSRWWGSRSRRSAFPGRGQACRRCVIEPWGETAERPHPKSRERPLHARGLTQRLSGTGECGLFQNVCVRLFSNLWKVDSISRQLYLWWCLPSVIINAIVLVHFIFFKLREKSFHIFDCYPVPVSGNPNLLLYSLRNPILSLPLILLGFRITFLNLDLLHAFIQEKWFSSAPSTRQILKIQT